MAAVPKWVPSAPALTPAPNSGAIDTTGMGTRTRIYTGKFADCEAGVLNPGTAGSGADSGLLVRNSTVTKKGGEIGTLTIVFEGYSFGGGGPAELPAETYGLQPVDQNLPVELNPGFDACAADSDLMAKVRTAGLIANESESKQAWDAVIALYTGSPSTPKYQQAVVLMDLLRRGTPSYYNAGWRHWWITYYLTLPTVEDGGFAEVPGSPLGSMLDGLGLSCLREADTLDVDQGFYKITSTWLCSKLDWNLVLYPP